MARKPSKRGSGQSNFNKRRKGALSIIIPWLQRFGMGVAICVGVLWCGSWVYLSGAAERTSDWAENKFEVAFADLGFTVEDIWVEGRRYTDIDVLLAIVNVEKGDPLFSFDPNHAKDLISQISWVEHVEIERRWPDTVYIEIEEREPLALWQGEKRAKLLDSAGDVIETGNLDRFSDLVMVTGKGAPKMAPALIQDLKAEPLIFKRVETAHRLGERRWDLRLKNGVLINLPADDVGFALRRLVDVHEKNGMLDKDIRSVDVREIGRVSVRTKPGAVQEYKADLRTETATSTKSGNSI